MLARVFSSAVIGVDGLPVRVEVDLARGLPSFSTVGLAEGAVREAKDRVRAAVRNCGYAFPAARITVNLAPAAVKKEGAGYDLPIALGILAASGCLPLESLRDAWFIGELSLDGAVRPVRGVLPMVLAARQNRIRRFFVPADNRLEAAVVREVEVVPVARLEEVVQILNGLQEPEVASLDLDQVFASCRDGSADFSEVRGQEYARRALEVAAAGGHNILLCGVPGTGKTMMARRLATILPDLTFEEAIETTKVYSTTGLLVPERPLVVERPFRAPHHTISDAGLIGGGQVPRPGEVSLAHNGVLFLDEFPEFRRHVLEVLRQPLEDGCVTIARAATTLRFPASFMLVAAMNPCPCGYLGDPVRTCRCTDLQVQRYRSRLSGPLLDRIDMHVEVPPVQLDAIRGSGPAESSEAIRERVNRARRIQKSRFAGLDRIHCNAHMGSTLTEQHCRLDGAASSLLDQACRRLALSARAYYRILKIARTIADLDGADRIDPVHLGEAIQYRRMQHGDNND